MKHIFCILIILGLLLTCFACSRISSGDSSRRLTAEDVVSMLNVDVKRFESQDIIDAKFRNISDSSDLWNRDFISEDSIVIDIDSKVSSGEFDIIMANADGSESTIFSSSTNGDSSFLITYDIATLGEYHLRLSGDNATGELSMVVNF